MANVFDIAQSFYIDPDAVAKADTVFITSVELFFESKPVAGKTKSGINKPGVTVHICPVINEIPDINSYYSDSIARVEYDSINTSVVAASPTVFDFNFPIPVKSDKTYAILIKLDDPDFKMWWNKSGEKILNTNQNTQVSSGKVDGFFYKITNGGTLTALRDADLKFNVQIAKFSPQSQTFKFSNKDLEFFTYYSNSVSGSFLGGEHVYQNTAPQTGLVAISNTSTTVTGTYTTFTSTFQVGDNIVVTDGSVNNTEVYAIATISNNTVLTLNATPSFSNLSSTYYKTAVGRVFDYNTGSEYLFLEGSTANSTVKFVVGEYVVGVDSGSKVRIKSIDNYQASYVRPMLNFYSPAGTLVETTYNFADSSYSTSSQNKVLAETDQEKFIDGYPAIIASRTNEVLNSTNLFPGAKTLDIETVFATSNPFSSPYIKEETLDFFTYRFEINNSAYAENSSYGNAASKYVSKKVVLADGMDSEDIRVYMTAYRPANTDIKLYVKLHNIEDTESFDSKHWTELSLADNSRWSSTVNRNDLVDLEFSLPKYHSGTTTSGFFTTLLSNNVITGTSGIVNTEISVGNLVRVYAPNVEQNQFIDIVTQANTSAFTIANAVDSASLVGNGFRVDVISDRHAAFLNSRNSNVVRYYNNALSVYDGYKTFTVKAVLLAENNFRVPFVDNIRAVAVSA